MPIRNRLSIILAVTSGIWTAIGYVRAAEPASPAKSFVPSWTADAVWYQIFPTRFCNGDTSNDPPGTRPWTGDWGDADPNSNAPLRVQLYSRAYGGDLQGVAQKLDYLASLGVNTLYLNPIFAAPSQHKYDTADHRHIDDSLAIAASIDALSGETEDPHTWGWSASDRYFRDLIKSLHKRGMRVVIDGVFNHVGREFWAWKDVLSHGRNSRFARWFDVTDWGPPLHYHAWDGDDGHLPRFRREGDGLDPEVERYLFAVVRRWMDPDGDGDPRDGIDGWRLDAAEQVPHGFWRRFRETVKSINPDAVILGEIWIDARPWLDGTQFDMVTNYPFSHAVVHFLRRGGEGERVTELADRLCAVADRYPISVDRAMMNLLGTHDTERAVSMLLDPTTYPGTKEEPVPQRDRLFPTAEDYQRLRLAIVVQYTWVGAPLIYYGDERGMSGGDDPFCRAPMYWEIPSQPTEAASLLPLYRDLGALRKSRAELRRGSCRVVLADDARGLMVFERTLPDARSMVLVNGSTRPCRVVLPEMNDEWQVVLDTKRLQLGSDQPPAGVRPALKPNSRLTLGSLQALIFTGPESGSEGREATGR